MMTTTMVLAVAAVVVEAAETIDLLMTIGIGQFLGCSVSVQFHSIVSSYYSEMDHTLLCYRDS